MSRFDDFVRIVLTEEGPLSNDQYDPGGLTKYGWSQVENPDIDVANLTLEQAIGLYRTRVWDTVHADELPAPLDLVVADAAVNPGLHAAITMLQEECKVVQDGVMGPVTIKAAHDRMPDLVPLYFARRCIHYSMQATFARYGHGLIARCFRLQAKIAAG